MWLYRQEPITVSHHPAKFGGHRHCGSGDIILLLVEEQDSTLARLNNVDHSLRNYDLHDSLITKINILRHPSNRFWSLSIYCRNFCFYCYLTNHFPNIDVLFIETAAKATISFLGTEKTYRLLTNNRPHKNKYTVVRIYCILYTCDFCRGTINLDFFSRNLHYIKSLIGTAD